MNRPPKFIWSVAHLQSIKEEIGDRVQIMALSPISFRMLAAMSDMVLWPSRYEEGELPDFAYDVHRELNNPENIMLEQINQRLEEIENMNITVNQKCGCGCGSGGSGYPPEWKYTADDLNGVKREFLDDGESYPPEFENRAEYDAAKCSLSGQLVDDFIESIGNMQTLSGVAGLGGAVLMQALLGTSVLSGAIVGLMVLGLSATAAVTTLIALFVGLIVFGTGMFLYFGHLHTELIEERQAMICGVFVAKTEDEVRQVFINAAGAAAGRIAYNDVTEGQVFGQTLSKIIDVMLPDELLSAVVAGVTTLVSGDRVYDCTNCAMFGFVPYVPKLAVGEVEGWTGTAVSTNWYTAGIRNSDSYNACVNDGWCFDGDLYSSTMAIEQTFTPLTTVAIEIHSSVESSFVGVTTVEVWEAGVLVHSENLNEIKFDQNTFLIGFWFSQGVEYTLKLVSSNAKRMITSIQIAST